MIEKESRLYQYLATFTGLLTIVTSGMHFTWTSPSIPQLTSGNTTSFTITEDEGSWIIIMQTMSPVAVCFFGALLNDKIGRKKTLMFTAVPYLIAWLMIVFASSMVELLVARIFAGLGDGIAFTVSSLYIGEIADPDIRGFLGTAISASWILGMLLINVIGSYLSIPMTAAISSVVPILFLGTFMWMPESPYFLIMKGRIHEAESALQKFKGKQNVDDDMKRLLEGVKSKTKLIGSAPELFSKKGNRMGLAILVIARNSQQMSGIVAFGFYTLAIFSEAGDFMSPLTATVTYVSVQFTTTCVCSFLIDKTGRRPLLVASLFGSALCLFVEGSYFFIKDFTDIDTSSFNFLAVLALISFVIIFNLGAQPFPLLIQGEIFPTDVKGLACCLGEVYFCLTASVMSKFFQVMRDGFGMYVPFYCFAFLCLVNLVFVIFFVPETKGKTLEEIQHELSGKIKIKERLSIH